MDSKVNTVDKGWVPPVVLEFSIYSPFIPKYLSMETLEPVKDAAPSNLKPLFSSSGDTIRS